MYTLSESCYQCGLPLPKKPLTENVSRKVVSFCCYGCLLANEITRERGEEGEAHWILLRLGLSAFFAMNVMILSFTDYIYPFDHNIASIINYINMIFTIPVMFLLGIPILKSCLTSISNLTLNMDVLIVIGTFSAFILSAYSTFKGDGKIYFDTASMILVLVTLGRLLEANAKAQASNAIKGFLELAPKDVTIIRNGKEERVPVESLTKEHLVKVIPGEIFPVDGEVLDGEGGVDESMLTGESKSVFKERGSMVFSGSTNLDGTLIFRVTRIGEEMFLSHFLKILEEARKFRAPVERLSDKISSIFIPLAITISSLTFFFWMAKSGVNTALMNSLSVLLISCPCALGLATPMAIWVALARAAKEGILIRTGETLENLSRIKRIFFDKTGTLTKRNIILTKVFVNPGSPFMESYLITVAASLESNSEHPIGISLVDFAIKSGHSLLPVSDFKAYPGVGIQGKINGTFSYLGNKRLMEGMGLLIPTTLYSEGQKFESEGITVVYCGWEGEVKGILGFSEQLREEAGVAISKLKESGLEVFILTGDNRYSAATISRILGVGVKSNLLPIDKVEEIKSFENGPTAMVGDGINDAPALSAANVGIALGCGMDLTRESADISLLDNDLSKIPWAYHLSRKTLRKIKENLFWAFFYNIVGIGLAVAGILQPILAAVAMIFSSILVLGNSLGLQKIKINN